MVTVVVWEETGEMRSDVAAAAFSSILLMIWVGGLYLVDR